MGHPVALNQSLKKKLSNKRRKRNAYWRNKKARRHRRKSCLSKNDLRHKLKHLETMKLAEDIANAIIDNGRSEEFCNLINKLPQTSDTITQTVQTESFDDAEQEVVEKTYKSLQTIGKWKEKKQCYKCGIPLSDLCSAYLHLINDHQDEYIDDDEVDNLSNMLSMIQGSDEEVQHNHNKIDKNELVKTNETSEEKSCYDDSNAEQKSKDNQEEVNSNCKKYIQIRCSDAYYNHIFICIFCSRYFINSKACADHMKHACTYHENITEDIGAKKLLNDAALSKMTWPVTPVVTLKSYSFLLSSANLRSSLKKSTSSKHLPSTKMTPTKIKKRTSKDLNNHESVPSKEQDISEFDPGFSGGSVKVCDPRWECKPCSKRSRIFFVTKQAFKNHMWSEHGIHLSIELPNQLVDPTSCDSESISKSEPFGFESELFPLKKLKVEIKEEINEDEESVEKDQIQMESESLILETPPTTPKESKSDSKNLSPSYDLKTLVLPSESSLQSNQDRSEKESQPKVETISKNISQNIPELEAQKTFPIDETNLEELINKVVNDNISLLHAKLEALDNCEKYKKEVEEMKLKLKSNDVEKRKKIDKLKRKNAKLSSQLDELKKKFALIQDLVGS